MPSNKHVLQKHRFKLIILFILFLGWWVSLPSPLFDTPYSTVVTSRENQLLGARIADDGQWRFPENDTVPYRFKQALLYFEDQHFYQHPGVNPISTAKALWANLTSSKRRGGSTLTQQVMRLAHKNPKRTYWEKLIESLQALRLEVRYSKDRILNLYSAHAPFGGNVIGLSAASWRYFGIPETELSWAQAATLAVLPNAPSLIFPGKNDRALRAKRNLLLKKLYRHEVIDYTTYTLALEEDLPSKPVSLPDYSPHFTEKIRKKHSGEQFRSSLSFSLQQKVNQIVENRHRVLQQNHIHNMAVLILDVDTRQVLAYVGNTPTTTSHKSYVDIISKPRSTGSILKPFLYAALLGDGELLPDMLVPDIPTNIDGYTPKNFDKKYRGAAPANEALTQSLNVPAVYLLKKYGLDRFTRQLHKIGQTHITKPAAYYGLPLILGGAESSLWDVTKAYAGMAHLVKYYNTHSAEYLKNEFTEPVYNYQGTANFGASQLQAPVFGAGGVSSTLEILQQVNRPIEQANWEVFESSQPIAWKTGTSYGFKDAWAVGATAQYAIGVWVGNADGEGRPGLVGIEAAAPVLFDVLAELPKSNSFSKAYDDMTELEVCKKSGYPASPYCEETYIEWVPLKGKRIKTCPFHHRVFLDQTEQYQVNSSCYDLSEMHVKNWFSLPPAQEYYYRHQHPNYKNLPPYQMNCLQDGEALMAFIYPKPKQSLILPKNFEEKQNEVIFKLAHRGKATKVFWYIDDKFIGETEEFHEIAAQPTLGKHILTVVDQEGNQLREKIEVKE